MMTNNQMPTASVEEAPKKPQPSVKQLMEKMNEIATRIKRSRRKRNKYCLPR
jgi:hypothetical protein